MKIDKQTGLLVMEEIKAESERTMKILEELQLKSNLAIKFGNIGMGLVYLGLIREELKASVSRNKFLASYFTEDPEDIFFKEIHKKLEENISRLKEIEEKAKIGFQEYKTLLETLEKEME